MITGVEVEDITGSIKVGGLGVVHSEFRIMFTHEFPFTTLSLLEEEFPHNIWL